MIFQDIIKKEELNKGWSADKKYVATTQGGKYLLRISSSDKKENREALYRTLIVLQENKNIPMNKVLEYGEFEEGVYLIYEWIDGTDAEDVVPTLPKENQYELGLVAGKALKEIHSFESPIKNFSFEEYYNKKIDKKIKAYNECGLKVEGVDLIIDYIQNNRYLLKNRPVVFQHGDYHIGNMMIQNNKLVIIDFDRYDYGDPFQEFNRIVWCAQAAPTFAKGIVDGYFDNLVPLEFWKLLALYICVNNVSSIPWAIPYGEQEVNVMIKQTKDILLWYNNLSDVIPLWYK